MRKTRFPTRPTWHRAASGLVYLPFVKGLNDPQQELPQLPFPLAVHQVRKIRRVDDADGDFQLNVEIQCS